MTVSFVLQIQIQSSWILHNYCQIYKYLPNLLIPLCEVTLRDAHGEACT